MQCVLLDKILKKFLSKYDQGCHKGGVKTGRTAILQNRIDTMFPYGTTRRCERQRPNLLGDVGNSFVRVFSNLRKKGIASVVGILWGRL